MNAITHELAIGVGVIRSWAWLAATLSLTTERQRRMHGTQQMCTRCTRWGTGRTNLACC